MLLSKKHIMHILLMMFFFAGIFIAAPAEVSAEEVAVEGGSILFVEEEGAVTITGYDGEPSTVNIPETIEDLPVTKIENYAFSGCVSLTTITIPTSVTSIGDSAFSDCESLTSIDIPASVTSIGDEVFNYCLKLTAINVADDNGEYCSEDGVLFDEAKTKLIRYPAGKIQESYNIPNGVIDIERSAFSYCRSLKSITTPNSVQTIGGYAFCYCGELISIQISDGVESIDVGAFSDCTSLTSINIPASVTSIEMPNTFDWCMSLTEINVNGDNGEYCSVDGVLFDKAKTKLICYPAGKTQTSYTIPAGVTCIGNTAFGRCENLEEIGIPAGMTVIEDNAFYCCASLIDITIPSSVSSIEGDPFLNCDNLENINVAEDNETYLSVDGVLFDRAKTKLIRHPINNGSVSYEIPNSVTDIGYRAFCGCESLTSITIPDGVKGIGEQAFWYCGVRGIIVPENVKKIGSMAFYTGDLSRVVIQAMDVEIEWGAFYDETNYYTVYGYENSSIQTYASENGIDFELIKALADDLVSVPSDTYTGEEIIPSVNYEEEPLQEGLDYIISYKDSEGNSVSSLINAGKYQLEITGLYGYEGTVTKNFEINPADISDMPVELSETSYTYDGSAKKPTVTIEGLEQETDFTVEYQNNIDPGQAKVIISGTGNYTGDKTECFAINEAEDDNVYVDVDTDGDGNAEKENFPANASEDGYLEADVDDKKDGKEKLIPVDKDGDGNVDHYVPDGVLIDDEDEEKKDGIYTPADVKESDGKTPEYIGIDGDDEGTEPDKFIKVEDSNGDGIYGDDANGDGEYDGLADDEGKKDNHYIPDQDGDGLAEPETDKDGVFEGTDDGEEYIPVDKIGDGTADDIVQVTDDNDDGVYEDKDGNRYIPDQDGDGLAEPDTDGNGAFEGADKDEDGNRKEYIPVDNTPDKPDGTVDEIIEAEEKDDAYKDDANDDGVFGGEGDNVYVPIDDDNDGVIDRYIPEDKFNEEDYEPIDKDDDGDIDHYVPKDKFDKEEYAPIDDDNDGDIDRYIPEDEPDKEKYVGIDDGNDGDTDRYIPKSEDVGHTHDVSRPATCKERAFCSICKDFYGEPLGHDWGGWTKVSATMHQRVCKNNDEHAETGKHDPALDCTTGAQCGICGAAGKDSHEYDRSKWVSEEGADTHWYGCIHCGAKEPNNEKPHDYPNKNVGKDVPQTCPTCNCGGYITEVHPEDFDKYEIPEAIREKYKTVGEIKNAMEKVARDNNQRVDGTLIFDAVLKYSVDGGDNWFVASEEHFPKNADGTYGKLPVKIEVPKETSIDTHDYKVVHMFSQSSELLRTKDGKPTVAGETETPDVIEEKGADGKEYISFYVNGLSPIMVAWEATPLNTARSIEDGENNNGEEDNAGGIPIDDNNDGDIDRYITEDEFDPDQYVPIDKDGDGDIDHYVPKDKFDKDKYVPIDIDGDDEADHYIPNGILTDPDGDGIYTPDGKKGSKYEGIDIDGDGVIDMFLLLDDEEGNGIDSGDDSDMLSWLLLMMTALTAGAITIAGRRYRRN